MNISIFFYHDFLFGKDRFLSNRSLCKFKLNMYFDVLRIIEKYWSSVDKSEKNDFEIFNMILSLDEKLSKTKRNLFSKLKHRSSMRKYSQNVRITKIVKQFTIDTIYI